MTDASLEAARAFRSKHGVILGSLQRLVNSPAGCVNSHIQQQLQTAAELVPAVLAKDGPKRAGQIFGAWMKIAFNQSPQKFIGDPYAAFGEIWGEWAETLHPSLSKKGAETLAIITQSAEELLRPGQAKPVRALFIGDCLLWDVALQLQIWAQAEGIAVEPTILAQRAGADLRRALLNAKESDFDLIAYSPYTYQFSAEYAFATSPLALLRTPAAAVRSLRTSLEDVKKTLDLLAARFECPIYVHTVSGAIQSKPGFRGAFAYHASLPARAMARRRLNRVLSDHIHKLNQMAGKPIMRVDERKTGRRVPLRALGLISYNAGELHPTRLAEELARAGYLRAVRVRAQLDGKKLIVADLDNTLWEGVIGEGAVRQHLDRQRILLSLKQRGIVLAIASKNDPKNVTWAGAPLSDDDFVAKMIDWSPKPANILAIAKQLNLKPSSFVFLDDRADEREMAVAAIPGLAALDPNNPETWEMLKHWAETMSRTALEDRTAMYQQRAKREEFLNSIAPAAEDVAEAYKSLELRLSLRHPDDREIARVAELINRTNQFNTTGARTTKQEMAERSKSGRVLIADVQDKFGSMGIAGALVAEIGAPWRITHFVLSCRVFGYGIEDAMLNAVKRWNGGSAPIHARLVETPANGPCRDVYARNGFERCGEVWVLEEASRIADPEWLAIEDETGKACATLASVAG